MVKRLIRAGADPKSSNDRGGSVLTATAANQDCDLELLQYLLKSYTQDEMNQRYVARTMKWRFINFVSIASYRMGIGRSGLFGSIASDVGQTALHSAVKLGNVGAVEALLNAGADPNVKTALGEDAFDFERKHGPFPQIAENLRGRASSREGYAAI